MPSIDEILKTHGITLEGDALSAFKKDLFADYKSEGEVKVLRDKITTLEIDKKTLSEERDSYKAVADAFDGEDAASIKELKEKYEALDKAAKEREEQETEKQKYEAFVSQFDSALGDKKFANPLIREQVIAETMKARETNAALGISDLIEQVTKDQNGIFENPNTPPAKELPGAGKEDEKGKEKPETMLDDDAIKRITGLPDDYKLP